MDKPIYQRELEKLAAMLSGLLTNMMTLKAVESPELLKSIEEGWSVCLY